MTNDTPLRDYLLGRLPEAEAERLEARLVEDDEVFQTLRGVEDDLFDEFARGTLGADDREAFQRRYGDQNQRVRFARALARRSASVVAFPRPRWIGLAAAASFVAVFGILVTQRATPPAGPATATPPLRPPATGGAEVLLTVALGTSRASGATPSVTVPADAATLRLRVRVDPEDRFENYSAALRSASGTVVWQSGDVRGVVEEGDLILRLAIPAASLKDGSYELAARGGGEDLGFVDIEVRRP